MCTSRTAIKIRKPEEIKHSFKIPNYMLNQWQEKGYSELLVKCGKCYECKQERARNWTYKIFLEALNHKQKCFITLTYKNVRKNKNQLNKKELQDFIKRLRRRIEPKKIKIFTAGEYGEAKGRPHYHLIILGYAPNDLKFREYSKKGHAIYDSKEIKETWGLGRISVQRFDYNEIGYISLYLDNNSKLNWKNKEVISNRKKALNELKVKMGIMIKTLNNKYSMKASNQEKYIYTPIKALKELTKIEYYKYKKEYEKIKKKYPFKLVPEFNTWSKGMGFETWINKEYYKYDLIIDNYKYETPKEYLRKVLDNQKKYNDDIINHVIIESLERKEYGEKQYHQLKERSAEKKLMQDISEDREAKAIWKAEDKTAKQENINRIMLYKKEVSSDF